MQAELMQFLRTLAVAAATGAVLYLLRHLLAWHLRRRLPARLVPQGRELDQPDANSRLVALIGHDAAVRETLGTVRLRATLGLRLVYWGVTVAMIGTLASMRDLHAGIGGLLLAVLLYASVAVAIYEIRYDRDTITLPRWWLGTTTRTWRALEAVTERQGWFLDFHFRGGQVIEVHKYVVGHAALQEKVRAVLREV
jgi:hypothetical protein